MKFENQTQAQEHIMKTLVSLDIFSVTDVNAVVVPRIVATIPSSSRDSYSADNTIAAAEYIEKFLELDPNGFSDLTGEQQQAGGGGGSNITETEDNNLTKKDKTPAKRVKYTPVNMASAAAERRISEQSSTYIEEGRKRQASASVTGIVVSHDYTKTNELLKKQKAIVKYDEAKFAEYEKNLVPTDENKAAFKAIKDAAINGTGLAPKLAEKHARAIGVRIKFDDTVQGKSQTTNFLYREEKVWELLITKLANRVPTTDELKVGIEYKALYAKETEGLASTEKEDVKPKIVYEGRADALKAGKGIEFANKLTDDKVPGSVPIDAVFEVYTDEDDPKTGEKRKKKVRLRGEVSQKPVYERNGDEMIQAFLPLEKKGVVGLITDGEVEKEKNKMKAALRAITNGDIQTDSEVVNAIAEEIRMIQETSAKTGTGAPLAAE